MEQKEIIDNKSVNVGMPNYREDSSYIASSIVVSDIWYN